MKDSDTRRSDELGFTLIEMLVVLVILLLSLAVALPNLRGPNSAARLDLVASQVLADLHTARLAAITRNVPVAITIAADGRSYQIGGARFSIALPSPIGLTLRANLGGRYLSEDRRIIFFPGGSSTGGLLTLANQRRSVGLRVEWATGSSAREMASQ